MEAPPRPDLRLRPLRADDLAFADQLRARAGWNQTLADWQRFVAGAPDGCFLAEYDGQPAGTATTTTYGGEVAWIGMVLVVPELRRRGIGRALLERCLQHLRERGVPTLKLDATPDGQPVYASLGFQVESTLTRWQLDTEAPRPGVPSTETPGRLQDLGVDDLPEFGALDAEGFGVARPALLSALHPQRAAAFLTRSATGALTGGGLLRPGTRAFQIGPVSARNDAEGVAVLDALLARTGGQPVFCDIPDGHAAAVRWARDRGFTRLRPLTRMYLGRNRVGTPERQFAIAGPDLG